MPKRSAHSIMVQRVPNLNNVDESYDFLKNCGVILAGTVVSRVVLCSQALGKGSSYTLSGTLGLQIQGAII